MPLRSCIARTPLLQSAAPLKLLHRVQFHSVTFYAKRRGPVLSTAMYHRYAIRVQQYRYGDIRYEFKKRHSDSIERISEYRSIGYASTGYGYGWVSEVSVIHSSRLLSSHRCTVLFSSDSDPVCSGSVDGIMDGWQTRKTSLALAVISSDAPDVRRRVSSPCPCVLRVRTRICCRRGRRAWIW
jgi:hypothetical protein